MWLSQMVSAVLTFFLSLFHGITTNFMAYDSILRVNKTPKERMLIWLKIIGTLALGFGILAGLVLIALRL